MTTNQAKSVFETPQGKVRYSGRRRYILVTKRSGKLTTPSTIAYPMFCLKRSDSLTVLIKEALRLRNYNTVYIVDSARGVIYDGATGNVVTP